MDHQRTGGLPTLADTAAPASGPTAAPPGDRPWRDRLSVLLFAADATSIVIVLGLAYLVRFGSITVEIRGINYLPLSAVLFALWLGMLVAFRSYEPRLLGVGTEEYRRVLGATFGLFGVIAMVSYLGKLEIARGFVGIVLPVGLALLLIDRFVLRAWVRSRRRHGQLCHRVVVVGDALSAAALSAQLVRERSAGFVVVGTCLPGDVLALVQAADADTVAVASSPDVSADDLRRISWALEGSRVDLVVAPAVTEVAGPRISIRPVAGLPLLYVDEPRFTGSTRLLKRALDLAASGIGLLLLSPLLILAVCAVRLTSPARRCSGRPGSARTAASSVCSSCARCTPMPRRDAQR